MCTTTSEDRENGTFPIILEMFKIISLLLLSISIHAVLEVWLTNVTNMVSTLILKITSITQVLHNQYQLGFYLYYSYNIIHLVLSHQNGHRGAEMSVQSSFKLHLPPHLIIPSSSLKLNETIGQGRNKTT